MLGDVNKDGIVDVTDRAIVNTYAETGSAGQFTHKDCDMNIDGNVDQADVDIVDLVWRAELGT